MTFEEWWGQLPPQEQKLLGINNARFVWDEAQKNMKGVLSLPHFMLSRFDEKVAIMSHYGEGGMFPVDAFDDAVSKFFADNF
jgi:hypothetical protein